MDSAMKANSFLMLVLLIAFLLIIPCTKSIPFQCDELKNTFPACQCEGKFVNNRELNSFVVINCQNLILSNIPPVMFSSNYTISELTLVRNNIQTLPVGGFAGLKIERLDLRENPLTTIEPNAFQGLEGSLIELYLGAQVGAGVLFPQGSLNNLTALKTLHLEYFKFKDDDVHSDDGLIHLSNLTSLTLRHNELIQLEIPSLPIGIISLKLEYQNFITLPGDTFLTLHSLKHLTFTHTQITVVNKYIFLNNTHLRSLDFSYNQIRVLDPNCFANITNSLQSLSLRNNPISDVTVLSEIKTLTALTSLQISQTGLTSLQEAPDFLMNKASLLSLQLEGNFLTTLGPSVFSNVGASLKELNLSGNQLSRVDEQIFVGLSALTTLDLSYQNLSYGHNLILPASMTSLSSLQTLRLSNTPLNQDNLWQTVSHLPSLTVLHLDATSMSSVNDFALIKLTQLMELNLENNRLTEITQEMLAGPRNLSKLLLSNNQIQTVNSCSFYDYSLYPSLTLELKGNPLQCDCKLNWILNEHKMNRLTIVGALCASPPDKMNQDVTGFQPGEFTCDHSQYEMPCQELYTTPIPTTTPTPKLVLTVTNISTTTISLKWTISDFPDLSYFKLWYLDLETSPKVSPVNVDKRQTTYLLTELKPDTAYSMCVTAYSFSSQGPEKCLQRTTYGSFEEQEGNGDSTSENETGIIIGIVIGTLALMAIIAVILCMLFRRKSSKKSELPIQPYTISANKPNGPDNHFIGPTERRQPIVGRALNENMISVISDGSTGLSSYGGSYICMDENAVKPGASTTRNDANSHDTKTQHSPAVAGDSRNGYYNEGFVQDTHAANNT